MNLIPQLNTLETSGLIRLLRAQPELEYLFRHALAQDAAYSSLLKQDRKHLHRSVAESLETLYTEQTEELAATLAWHFEHAELGDKAIPYLRLAGDRARAMYANQEALGFYQRAIAHIEQLTKPGTAESEQWHEAEIATRESMADLAELSGNHEMALAGYDQVGMLLNASQKLTQARLYRKSANIWVVGQDFDRAKQLFAAAEAALDKAGDDRTVEEWSEWILIQLDRAWLFYLANQVDQATAHGEKARPIIERYGTAIQRARFFSGLSQIGFRRDRYIMSDETLALARVAFKAWQESGSIIETGMTVFGVGFCHLWRGEHDEAERMLLYGLGLAERTGDLVLQTFYLTYLTVLYRKLGKLDEVKRFTARSLEVLDKTRMKQYQGMAEASLSWLAWREGHFTDVLDHAQKAIKLWSALQSHLPVKWVLYFQLIAIAITEGRTNDAVDFARILLEPAQQILPAEITTALEQSIITFEQKQMDQAHALLEEAVRLAKQTGHL